MCFEIMRVTEITMSNEVIIHPNAAPNNQGLFRWLLFTEFDEYLPKRIMIVG